jgi:hypothetical protein
MFRLPQFADQVHTSEVTANNENYATELQIILTL